MALEPPLELTVVLYEVADDLDDDSADTDSLAVDVLLIGGVPVQLSFELARQMTLTCADFCCCSTLLSLMETSSFAF